MYVDQSPFTFSPYKNEKQSKQEDKVNNFSANLSKNISIKSVPHNTFKLIEDSINFINGCFRCHDYDKMFLYNEYRITNRPQIVEPTISSIYENQCFISMEEIGKWIKNPSQQQYPGLAKKIPKILKTILDHLYEEFGMIPNFQRFLLFYPSYLERHYNYYKCLILETKLSRQIVYFIGFCSAAEMGSAYMMARMVKKFKQVGGKMEWILQNQYPSNLQRIIELIRVVGRCPWTFTIQLLNNVLNEKWTLKVLIQIIQIVTFIQQMSTLSLAMGLNIQQPSELSKIEEIIKIKHQYDDIVYEEKEGAIKLSESVKSSSTSTISSEENAKKIKQIEKQKIQPYMKEIGASLSSQEIYKQINFIMKPLLPSYEVIEKRDQSLYPKFDSCDYNFQKNSFPLLQGFTHENASRVYDLIKHSQKMTFSNFGSEQKTNTKDFRRACRYYAQNLVGFNHLQYNYKKNIKMNEKTSMSLRFYIRLLMMSPIHIKKQVIKDVDEKINRIECFDLGHVAVMIANSKMSFTLMMMTRSLEG